MYQFDKFLKHTLPSNQPGLVSVFDDPTYPTYENYIISGSSSGSTIVQPDGNISMVWYAGRETGFTYNNGQLIHPNDGVKVVLHDNVFRIHAYPVDVAQEIPIIQRCSECGCYILT